MPRRFVDHDEAPSKYKRFSNSKAAGDGYLDIQFEKPPQRIPYKAILLATALFVAGSVLITVGSLLLTGYINAKYADRTWPVMILGVIMFIPGAYHIRIAYYAYKGYDGFNYEDIPEFD